MGYKVSLFGYGMVGREDFWHFNVEKEEYILFRSEKFFNKYECGDKAIPVINLLIDRNNDTSNTRGCNKQN